MRIALGANNNEIIINRFCMAYSKNQPVKNFVRKTLFKAL